MRTFAKFSSRYTCRFAGGENGFNQAIELSAEMLSNVKFVQEKRLIGRFFEEISQDSGKFVFGVKDTLQCLEMGSVEILIIWENLDCDRYELLNTATGKIEVKMMSAEQVRPHRPGCSGSARGDDGQWHGFCVLYCRQLCLSHGRLR